MIEIRPSPFGWAVLTIPFWVGALIVGAWNLSERAPAPRSPMQFTCPESPAGMTLNEFADTLSRCVEKAG